MPLFHGVGLSDHHEEKTLSFNAARIVTSEQARNGFEHDDALAIDCNDEQRPRDAHYCNGYWF